MIDRRTLLAGLAAGAATTVTATARAQSWKAAYPSWSLPWCRRRTPPA